MIDNSFFLPHTSNVFEDPRGLAETDVAALRRLGRPTEPGGLGPAVKGHAQEGGGPVDSSINGFVEVASS
jgi:hypothetical protein